MGRCAGPLQCDPSTFWSVTSSSAFYLCIQHPSANMPLYKGIVSESHTGATPHAPRRAPQGTPGSSSSSSHGVSPHGGASGSPDEGGTDPARQQEGLGASHGSSEPGTWRGSSRDIEDILGTFAKNVGFLDIDICGPTQPRVLGTAEEKVHSSGAGWSPVYVSDNLAVMSVGFLLNSADDAVIWRGPKKDVIDEVVFKHVAVDEVALLDVRKEITFCRKVNIPIIGLVENMTTFVCPKCKTKTAIFPATTGCDPQLAEDTEMPLLGQLPLDPWVAQACDEGTNIPTRARCCCHSGIQRHCKQNQGVL
ncbi:LOW QUALITY PROTEIN: cytosolic Fe-S cluster assembly factor nubp1-like [Scylla paramamosain]|uniref:LOW QUALITY PROTEIN: cytosolic Fe-S cluster assembly factor nubp1-like n=1 Tax=Scylla paramamosain TaxID=85552 RepID=UPI0030832A3F